MLVSMIIHKKGKVRYNSMYNTVYKLDTIKTNIITSVLLNIYSINVWWIFDLYFDVDILLAYVGLL